MATRARSNAGHVRSVFLRDWMPGRRYARRKGCYLTTWEPRTKENRTRANRDDRHRAKAELRKFA